MYKNFPIGRYNEMNKKNIESQSMEKERMKKSKCE